MIKKKANYTIDVLFTQYVYVLIIRLESQVLRNEGGLKSFLKGRQQRSNKSSQ